MAMDTVAVTKVLTVELEAEVTVGAAADLAA